MRYTTFRNLAIVTGLALVMGSCGACFYLFNRSESKTPPPPTGGPVAQSGTSSSSSSSSSTNSSSQSFAGGTSGLTVGADGLRPIDKQIVEFLARPGSGEKVKDAFPREKYKVSVYRDGTDSNWSRIKIDYNRNEKWDEKWTLEAGQPAKRQVASKDDEQYDVEYRWRGGKWEVKNK